MLLGGAEGKMEFNPFCPHNPCMPDKEMDGMNGILILCGLLWASLRERQARMTMNE